SKLLLPLQFPLSSFTTGGYDKRLRRKAMKFYPAAQMAIRAIQMSFLAEQALNDTEFEPYSPNAKALLNKVVSENALHMAVGVLARLEILDDPLNDSSQ